MKYALLALSLAVVGCSSGGGSAPVPAARSAAPVAFATPAVAQNTPSPSLVAVLGDSISAGYNPGTGYVYDPAAAWPAFIGRPDTDLGIPGSQEPAEATSVAQIPAMTTVVIYAGGTNDACSSGLTGSALTLRIDDMLAHIHAQAPQAMVIFLNVRQFVATICPTDIATVATNVVAWNAHEAALGPVIDIGALDPGVSANYPDGIHPSQTQAQALGEIVAATLR